MTEVFGFPRDGHLYSADEVGRALAGLFARESNGAPQVGMLSTVPVVAPVGSSWQVQVGVFSYVHQVAGSTQLSGLSAAEQVSITPAAGNIPAGQARIDLIGWNPSTAKLVLVDGAPAVNPVAPSDASLARIALVGVNAGDGAVIAGQITMVAELTELAGASGVLGTFTPSPGWTPVSGEESSLERIGRVCYLNTALTIAAVGSFASILTVPEKFRPERDVFVGYSQVSGGAGRAHGQLFLRPTGVLQMRYYQGGTNAGNILPVSAQWRLPRG